MLAIGSVSLHTHSLKRDFTSSPLDSLEDQYHALSKQIGLVCHPLPGHVDDTLANALVAHSVASYLGMLQEKNVLVLYRLGMDTSGSGAWQQSSWRGAKGSSRPLDRLRALGRRHIVLVQGYKLPYDSGTPLKRALLAQRETVPKWPNDAPGVHERPLPPLNAWPLKRAESARVTASWVPSLYRSQYQIRSSCATLVILLLAISFTMQKDTSLNPLLTGDSFYTPGMFSLSTLLTREYRSSRHTTKKTWRKKPHFCRAIMSMERLRRRWDYPQL